MRSIRSFLLVWLVGGAALILAVAGTLAFVSIARALEARYDRNLTDRVQGFASILFQVGDEVEFQFSGELMPEYEREELPSYFQLWFAGGELLERSDSLGKGDLSLAFEPGPEPAHWTAPLPDGRPGRYVVQQLEIHHVFPEQGPDRPEARNVVVVVARGREELVAAERDLLALCAVSGIVVLALIAGLSWIAVNRGLAPAGRLAAALHATRVERLPDRLEVGPLPRELAPMAETANELIGRVRVALERERRTSADIAHELRTPISELLTVSEVALRGASDEPTTRRALATVRDVAWRMGRSVATLLKLARLDVGSETFARDPIDLGALVAECLRSLNGLAAERALDVMTRIDPGELVTGDEEVMRIVVANLLSNALYYTPEGGRVDLRLERARGVWRFEVENEAPGLAEADLGALTEPFWRKERARTDRGRSGLGLALSRALTEKAGLRLDFELEGEMFRATLSGREGRAATSRAARPEPQCS